MYSKEQLIKISTIIAAIGAINWALAAMDFNIISMIFGDDNPDVAESNILEKALYFAVGASGVFLLYNMFGGYKLNPKMKVYYF
jgi:uncharacterized membrane protein YuzA (DUF378 family)